MNKQQHLYKPILIFLSYFIYSYIIITPLAIFHIELNNLSSLFKTIYLLIGDFFFIGFLICCYYDELKKDLNDFLKHFSTYLDDGFQYWIIGLAIMTITNALISIYTPSKIATNEQLVRDLITNSPFYMLLGTALCAPIVEEIIFRKTLRPLFPTKWVYIIMSGLVFGGLHILTSFTNRYELLYIIPYGALGSAFAYLYYKTNNIINPILMHSIHNISLVLLFIFTK